MMALRQYTVRRPAYLRRRRFPKRLFLGLFLAIAVMGGGVYALFFSGLLAVGRIEFHGKTEAPPQELHDTVAQYLNARILSYIPKNNVLLISPREIEERILGRFPKIRRVVVAKRLPNRISVDVREREYAGVWCAVSRATPDGQHASDGADAPRTATSASFSDSPLLRYPSPSQCYLLDAEGVIYSEAAESSGILQLKIFTPTAREPRVGDAVLDPADLAFLKRARDLLESRFGIRTAYIVQASSPDIEVHTADGWRMLFDTARPLEDELGVLAKTILAMREGDVDIEYIDLRTEGRVYYKTLPRLPESKTTAVPEPR